MKKFMIISCFVFTMFGCSNDSVFEGLSDDSSKVAVLEQAAMDLDDGNYEEVISSLAELYTTTALDSTTARLLASAYMGRAGIDVTNFIFYSADEEADNFDSIEATLSLTVTGDTCSVSDGSVLVIDGDGVFISSGCIDEMVESLENARDIIYDLRAAGLDTTDDYMRSAIISAVHYVFIVGSATADGLGASSVPINKEAYALLQSSDTYSWTDLDASDFDEADDDGDGLTRYQKDLIEVNNAINVIDQATSGANDIKDELEEFLREVLVMPTGDITDSIIIQTVISTGIFNYVNGI